jgi:thioredoxin-related protein
MRNSARANIEFALNIVIAIAIVIVTGVVVKRSFFTSSTSPVNAQQPQITVGTRVTVPNVDWKQNKKSLIFFLKKDCTYCNKSAPLYRVLLEEASKRDVKSLAILPDSIDVGTQYVHSLNLPIENVRMGSLSHYQIPGAPSVLFVDDQGIVRGAWIGMAPPDLEEKMRSELFALFGTESFNGSR